MTAKKTSKNRDNVVIFLNGKKVEITGDDAFMMLAEWLRKRALRPGTKIVCAEGDCGACTVLRAFKCKSSVEKLKFLPINSCITTVAQMDGSHIVTVEGLAIDENLSPVQNAMRSCHGSQCGYCTPGFVMALTGATEVHDTLDRKTAANYLTGNLCRCTGYAPILDAAEAIKPDPKFNVAKRYLTSATVKELQTSTKASLQFADTSGRAFSAPATLKDACKFLRKMKGARLIAAATDIGVQTNKGRPLPEALLSLQNIDELYDLETSKNTLHVGARVTLSRLRVATAAKFPELSRFLDIFASPQIKNSATLVGNLANASPIGDTLPMLLATDAVIHTAYWGSGKLVKRKIPATKFFLGYKKLAIKPYELIYKVEIPLGKGLSNLRLYKSSQRKDLDISAVGAAFRLQTNKSGQVTDAALALGGVAATPMRLPSVEKLLIGKKLDATVASVCVRELNSAIMPLSDVRGTAGFRRVLATNMFKTYLRDVFEISSPESGAMT
jgi:xanthine dehydrogenase small subunit